MTPEALRIARELAELLQTRKSSANFISQPQVRDAYKISCSRPLNREELALRDAQRNLLRDFQTSRYYARLRIRARRENLSY